MKLVDKQVLRELVGPFVFGVTAFSSVFFAGTYLLRLTDWVMRGMPLITAIQIVALLLPSMMFYTLPMASLLAVLLGIGRLSGDSETVALYAGGISFYRVAFPIVAMGIVISGCSIALNEFVSPQAYSHYQEIQAQMMKQAAPANHPFTVPDDETSSLVYVKGGMDVDSGTLRNVTVTQFGDRGPRLVIYADRAVWEGIANKYRWSFHNGWSQLLGTDSGAIQTFRDFQTREVEIGKNPQQFALYQKSLMRDTDQLSYRDLTKLVTYLHAHPDRPLDQIRKIEVDRWRRLAFPISSLVFAMLAAPLGIRPHRSSSSVGFGLSVLLIFLYWMVWNYTSSLAIQGNLAPAAGAFLADVLGIAAAVLLVRRAAK